MKLLAVIVMDMLERLGISIILNLNIMMVWFMSIGCRFRIQKNGVNMLLIQLIKSNYARELLITMLQEMRCYISKTQKIRKYAFTTKIQVS